MSRIAVIGAGLAGLACAYSLAAEGHAVVLLDRDPEGDKCSWGNAGGIAVTEVVPASVPGALWRVPGWLVDPLGPLSLHPLHAPRMTPWLWRFVQAGQAHEVRRIAAALGALLGRVYADLLPLLDDLGLAACLRRVGALTVYESRAALARDAAEWDLKRRQGIECRELPGGELRDLEPALSPGLQAGVFTPAWSHVTDPKRIWSALLGAVQARGVAVERQEVLGLGGAGELLLPSGPAAFDITVVAGGAWSGRLARSIGDQVLLESERGYNTTFPSPGVTLTREVIFAERKFVATPLDTGLRIGGAAEFAGLERPANHARAGALAALARRCLPGLTSDGGTVWMGQRPATPDSLPVIGRSPRRADVIYAFGHGHLGLTLAATTGRFVAALAAGRDPGTDLAPCSISRFSRMGGGPDPLDAKPS